MVPNKTADTALMRISAAARAAGVSKQTVEYYIMIGLISPVRVKGRAGRYFDRDLVPQWSRAPQTYPVHKLYSPQPLVTKIIR